MERTGIMQKRDRISAITISGYRDGERQRIVDLLCDCGLHTEDITRELLRDFILVRKGDDIVGVIGLEVTGADALVRSLAVRQSYRGQGIGKKLTSAIERHARARGVQVLYLLTLTAEDFFIAQGYRHSDRSTAPESIKATLEFRSLCPQNAVCLRKRVRPAETH